MPATYNSDCRGAASGVQPAQHTSGGIFTVKRGAFLTQLKAKVGSSLAKAAAMRVNLNIDGTPITSRSHTHPSHSQASRFNLVSIFRCSSSTHNGVHTRRVDSSTLVFSLSSHRYPLIVFGFSARFNDS